MENYKTSKVGMETARKYADIIDMERPQNEESLRKHPRMTLQNRAKIFSPFAALRGYDDQLAEEKQRSERVTKKILTEEEMAVFLSCAKKIIGNLKSETEKTPESPGN